MKIDVGNKLERRLQGFFSPGGKSQPVVSASHGEKSNRPLMRTLVAAGLASFVALTTMGDALAQGDHGYPLFEPGAEAGTSINDLDTNSPDLGVFGQDLNKMFGVDASNGIQDDVRIMAADLRDDSPTYGQGFAKEFMGDLEKYLNTGAVARSVSVKSPDGQGFSWDKESTAESMDVCLVVVGGRHVAGSIEEKVKSYAYLNNSERDHNVSTTLTDYEYDMRTFYHELGHCLSGLSDLVEFGDPDHVDSGIDSTSDDYHVYWEENRADIFATLMLAQELGAERAIEISGEIQSMRLGGALALTSFIQNGLLGPGDVPDDELLDTSQVNTIHYTVDGLGAAMNELEMNGIDKSLSPIDTFILASKLANDARMSFPEFERFRSGLLDIQADAEGGLTFPQSLIDIDPDIAQKAERAFAFFDASAADLGFSVSADLTAEHADTLEAETLEASLESLLENELRADIEAGAEVVDFSNERGRLIVQLRESSGDLSSVKVKGTSIMRYNDSGRLHSFSEDRPAFNEAGWVMHSTDGYVTGDEFQPKEPWLELQIAQNNI